MNRRPEESDRSERGEEADGKPGLSDGRLYRALASTRRRRVLYLLLDERVQSVDAIATVLTGWEATERGGMGTPQDHERTTVDLEHSHLPLLAEAELVDYDRQRRSVCLRPLDPAVRKLIRQSISAEDVPGREDV